MFCCIKQLKPGVHQTQASLLLSAKCIVAVHHRTPEPATARERVKVAPRSFGKGEECSLPDDLADLERLATRRR